ARTSPHGSTLLPYTTLFRSQVQRRSRESRWSRARFGGRAAPGSCCPKTSIDSNENSRRSRGSSSAREDRRGRRKRRAQRAVELRSVPPFSEARTHALQQAEEERLERAAEMLFRELESVRGIAQNL